MALTKIAPLLVAMALASPAFAQGTLRVAIGTDLTSLDPAKATIGDEYIYDHLVFNGLTKIEPDQTVKPDLATSWTTSDDLKIWTFKLREGVKFHNGRVLDAEDVVVSMKRLLDPATASRARTNLTMVEKVEALDPLTVKFTLNIPYAGFQDIFGERQLKIVPRDALGDLATKPVGTGPFMFKSYALSDRLELVKNPNYFESGLPKLDGVTLRIIPEAAARLTSLQSGAIDLLWSLPYEAIDGLKKDPNIRLDSVATATWDGVILNNKVKPFDDVRVRQAFEAAIDKEMLVELTLFGQGAPTHSPIPPNHPYFNSSLPFPPPDIAKAKKLLAEAGYPNGFEVTMQVPQEREARVRLGVSVRDMVAAAGIKVNVQRVPFATYSSQVSGKQAMYVDGYFARPTIDTATYAFYHSTGSWNAQLWNYKNDDVDRLLDKARQTQDEGQRKQIFQDFQKVVYDTVPGLIAYAALHVNGVRKGVEGFRSTPMQWLELKEVSMPK